MLALFCSDTYVFELPRSHEPVVIYLPSPLAGAASCTPMNLRWFFWNTENLYLALNRWRLIVSCCSNRACPEWLHHPVVCAFPRSQKTVVDSSGQPTRPPRQRVISFAANTRCSTTRFSSTMPLAHLFCALLELEPQRSDNSVGVLMVIVLSACRLAVVAAVVAFAAVLWHTTDVAVRWFDAVFCGVGLDFSVVGNCCPIRSCCLGGGTCGFLEFGSSALVPLGR